MNTFHAESARFRFPRRRILLWSNLKLAYKRLSHISWQINHCVLYNLAPDSVLPFHLCSLLAILTFSDTSTCPIMSRGMSAESALL